jgi:phosphoglycerate dehydrogenase-like enzyme
MCNLQFAICNLGNTMSQPVILILEWMPPEMLGRLASEFPSCTVVDARAADVRERLLAHAVVTYGMPPPERLQDAPKLRWIQLISAGVPPGLCEAAQAHGWIVTNLAGLYGAGIAEHAVGMMLVLSRNLQVALRQQLQQRWDRALAHTMADVHGKTLAVLGLGNIGQNIARLARVQGMRVVGCRRTPRPTPFVDRLYTLADMHAMLAEADYLAIAVPLTSHTQGMLGVSQFAAMKRGLIYINVSRGGVAQEEALLDALRGGHVAAAGLDVFAVEPLPADHPLWTMPQVFVSPHVSGETINQSALPAQRFARNLVSWLAGADLEGRVDLHLGY